ncbi:hypothetical protein K469DRAFT_756095 [Zopfia rhizophila CBS 207.26]|uniref:Uncharacterized protein n=1 Tax=Zopfia rhizophila CBS 207.26 TaxID=1314779 RepID=A0A6A6D992_9PEZI|nr:hypothetical protein K469DRAFT_756095 [Zopfia rhizophila CBS 207.26]
MLKQAVTDSTSPAISRFDKLTSANVAGDLDTQSSYTERLKMPMEVFLLFFCFSGIDTLDIFLPDRRHLNRKDLQQALSHARNTLSHLVIVWEPYATEALDIWEDAPRMITGTLGSLRTFSHLATLEIELSVLLGWGGSAALTLAGVLPSNLRYLTFRDDCWEMGDWPWQDSETIEIFRRFWGKRGLEEGYLAVARVRFEVVVRTR